MRDALLPPVLLPWGISRRRVVALACLLPIAIPIVGADALVRSAVRMRRGVTP